MSNEIMMSRDSSEHKLAHNSQDHAESSLQHLASLSDSIPAMHNQHAQELVNDKFGTLQIKDQEQGRPLTDIQKHLTAFDIDHKGKLSVGNLMTGFEDIGYNPFTAGFKAAMAEAKFGGPLDAIGLGSLHINEVKPEAGGMYNKDGNLDISRVDGLFHGKSSINESDVDAYLKNRGFVEKLFVEGQFDSAFKLVGKDSISRDEFIGIMNGDLIKQKIEAAEAKKEH